MTIVTTEVSFDLPGLIRRLERKNDKNSLASKLARIHYIVYNETMNNEEKIKEIEWLVSDSVWGI